MSMYFKRISLFVVYFDQLLSIQIQVYRILISLFVLLQKCFLFMIVYYETIHSIIKRVFVMINLLTRINIYINKIGNP